MLKGRCDMRSKKPWLAIVFSLVCLSTLGAELPPIEKIEVGPHGGFLVNGQPFFPLMSWLQDVQTYPRLGELGFNVFMGNWRNQPPPDKMAEHGRKAGGYVLPHFVGTGIGNPYVFGWFDRDEPDLTSNVWSTAVKPGAGLVVNRGAPLQSLIDGNLRKAAVLDPMADASVTIEMPAPVTVRQLAVHLPARRGDPPGNPAPAELLFLGDGRELLRTPVADRDGRQIFDLPAPATFRALEVRVVAVHAGSGKWGTIQEIEALDADGKNALFIAPRGEPHLMPEGSLAAYRRMKEADPTRPVFLTLTCRFLPRYEGWHKAPVEFMRPLYPQWAAACDALGTDIYPIYGFNKPEWLLDNIEALQAMRKLAGPGKPLYIWIETCNGGAQQGSYRVEPKHTRAEVWMSIIAGARAIGYFTHAFKPSTVEFAVEPAMQTELRRLNRQITRLTPEILAAPADPAPAIEFADGIRGHLMATRPGRGLFIVAQNLDLDGRAALATIRMPGLAAGTRIEVVDEDRAITAGDGVFQDTFEALREHIYRIP